MSLRVAAATLVLAGTSSLPASADPWPGFRGPTGQGHSKEIRLPVRWSATEGVLWKTPVDGAAWSSPIVWGGRVFVTTARDQGRACHVVALDRRTGAVLWDTLVFTQQLKRKEDRNSYASPTPVTDGSRVFAVFGDGSLVAVDAASGAVAWTNRDFPFYSQHGLGSSLVLYRGSATISRCSAHSTAEALKLNAGPALWWRALTDAAEAGCREFNCGITWVGDPGLIKWKEGWGGTSRAVHIYVKPITARAPAAGGYFEGFRLAKTIWKRMPLPVVDRLGQGVTRWIG